MARQHLLGYGWLSKAGKMEDFVHPDLWSIQGDTNPLAYEHADVDPILRRSWWTALCQGGILRCLGNALRFFFYRLWHKY